MESNYSVDIIKRAHHTRGFSELMKIWHLYIRGVPPLNLSFITSRLLMLLVIVNLDDMRQKWRGLIAPSQINDISKHGLSSPKS